MNHCSDLLEMINASAPERRLRTLRDLAASAAGCGHFYPSLHRLADVVLEGEAFRIMRCAACGEKATVLRISLDAADPKLPGVPCELEGERLRRWVLRESEDPAKGPVDWKKWLSE